jgi:hypothetical protein
MFGPCKLEVTELNGIKTVTYPDCNKEEFIFGDQCKNFKCYKFIGDRKYETLIAMGVYTDTDTKDKYACTTKTSLIIPKGSIVERRDSDLYADRAYVYNNSNVCGAKFDLLRTTDLISRYCNNDRQMFEVGKEVKTDKYIYFRYN